jgi:hypothetical protein
LDGLVTGIFDGEAPEGQAFPYLVWQNLPSPEQYTFTRRSLQTFIYQLVVHAEGHDKTAANAARDAIDTALNLQPLDVAGHSRTTRDETFDLPPTRDEGKTVQHVGATYRIQVVP